MKSFEFCCKLLGGEWSCLFPRVTLLAELLSREGVGWAEAQGWLCSSQPCLCSGVKQLFP